MKKILFGLFVFAVLCCGSAFAYPPGGHGPGYFRPGPGPGHSPGYYRPGPSYGGYRTYYPGAYFYPGRVYGYYPGRYYAPPPPPPRPYYPRPFISIGF